ncbi:MAG: UDP-N-acetylmuramoyl-tripeptide--D-alanyl-D-alanine ligase [Deltaproteobacteria bacterium]|nr:UDP-N-acetylmuramoyl-tripeptide--D-alanyl-D-alanine ligase [Deltaproteobacteria bacterium]
MTRHGHTTWIPETVLVATQGNLLGAQGAGSFSTVCIDSREVVDGALFVAIEGPVQDGHRFIPQAVAAGARGLVVNQDKVSDLPIAQFQKQGIFCVAVPDTTRALGDLAAYHRQRMPASVVAITGSYGKTTTREMMASIFSRNFNTLSAKKNFNNEWGLPLTLLSLAAKHQWAICEMGMNRFGEIRRLGQISRPDIGLITNVGPVHLAGVESLDGVMAAKGELLESIHPNGTVVLNADDPRGLLLGQQARCRVFYFGLSPEASVRAESICEAGEHVAFRLILPGETVVVRGETVDVRGETVVVHGETVDVPGETVDVTLNVPGRFMVENALAAAAVGHLAGISGQDIKAGLEAFCAVSGRMKLIATVGGIRIIDDAYNASPATMPPAIEILDKLKGDRRGFLILGDMAELGPESEAFHRQLGRQIARSRATRIYLTGDYAQVVKQAAIDGNMDAGNFFIGSRAEILANIKPHLQAGDWVLVKASRSIGLERAVADLLAWAGGEVKGQ